MQAYIILARRIVRHRGDLRFTGVFEASTEIIGFFALSKQTRFHQLAQIHISWAFLNWRSVSVGSKMSPAEIMSALGISHYETNPPRSFDQALIEKYGIMAAADIERENIGPFCDDELCIVPYGIGVGTANHIPVKAAVSFHDGQITEIVVSFGKTYWDEMVPIFDEKYGADWKVEREYTVVTDFETKKGHVVQGIFLQHLSNGTNRSTKDHCKIWASSVDMVFEHHDAFGPYHSEIVIQLISKNF